MNFLGIFETILRWLLWNVIVKVLLFLIDILYDVIKSIAFFNILDNSTVWLYYSGFISAFLVLFIVIRLTRKYLLTIVDEEESERFKPDNIILKLASIGFLVVLLPFVLKTMGNLLSQLVNSIESIFSFAQGGGSFASVLVSTANGSPINVQQIDTIDINQKVNDAYVYIPSLNNFLCLVIVSVFAGGLMLLIGIHIGSRLLGMVLKLIIAPYTLSSIVDDKDSAFEQWWKFFISDFLATYMQMILLIVGTTLFLNINFNTGNQFTDALAKDIVLVGALFGILNAPSSIGHIIASDIGVGSTLQSIQTTSTALHYLNSGNKLIKNAASYAIAGATYLTGRAVGGNSMANIAQQSASYSKNGFSGFDNITGGSSVNTQNVANGAPLQQQGAINTQPSLISNREKFNFARGVSNASYNSGSKFTQNTSRVISHGAARMYKASMNRINQGFTRSNRHNTFTF